MNAPVDPKLARLVPRDCNVESGNSIGLYADGHGYVAFVLVCGAEHFKDAQRENARRLLASWNACVGITTERLEQLAERGGFAQERLDEAARLLGHQDNEPLTMYVPGVGERKVTPE